MYKWRSCEEPLQIRRGGTIDTSSVPVILRAVPFVYHLRSLGLMLCYGDSSPTPLRFALQDNHARDNMIKDTIQLWHSIVEARDAGRLDDILDEQVVFHSPVVHTPQVGRQITKLYLSAAIQVFGNPSFRYVREVIGEQDAVLEFTTEIEGIIVNGVDMIRWNDEGRIIDFKVMVRPLKAINLIHRMMGEMLQRLGK